MYASHSGPETLRAKERRSNGTRSDTTASNLQGRDIEDRRYAEMSQDELSSDLTCLLILVNNDEGPPTFAPVLTLLTSEQ